MIGRKSSTDNEQPKSDGLQSFDDFEIRLGDVMRGERATMGKSLLDVQRELRIKAAYVAAIENADPSAFDTPGFVAGYVRSYARYLGMDPEEVFAAFCAESGYSTAHGMSPEASVMKKSAPVARASKGIGHDPFASATTPFVPESQSVLADVDFRAIGSFLVLVAVACGLAYGAWTLLRSVQKVTFAPVEQVPVVLSDLDPLDGAAVTPQGQDDDTQGAFASNEALDRLYRPQALDLPVLTARDAPISTLDPSQFGAFQMPELPQLELAEALPVAEAPTETVPQVVEEAPKVLTMVAVRPSWVRVRAADGSVIFEGIMDPGSSWEVPATEEPPTLRAGESGAIYFALGDEHFGPLGARGVVTKNLPMSVDEITGRYDVADIARDQDLARMVAEAEATAD